MKNFSNTLKLSLLLFRQEKKRIVFYNIIFFIMIFITIICSTLSLELDNFLISSDATSSNIQKQLSIHEKDLDLPDSTINYARSLGKNTIVKKTEYSLNDNLFSFYFNYKDQKTEDLGVNNPAIYGFNLSPFYMIDPDYDTYDMYDNTLQNKTSFTLDMDLAMIVNNSFLERLLNSQEGQYVLSFTYQNQTYSLDIEIIAFDQTISNCLMSPNLVKKLQELIPNLQENDTTYVFSYENILNALNLYLHLMSTNPLFNQFITFTGMEIANSINSFKQVGIVLFVITIFAFITIVISFINMILILFLDKQKYIGLLRVQGVTNFRLGLLLIVPLLFTLLITSLFAIISSILLSTPLLTYLAKNFVSQFIKNISLGAHYELSILLPLFGYILIAVPIIIFIIFITKKDTISLIKGN